MKKTAAVLISCAVLCSGCAGMSDSERTRAEGTGTGAAAGAALGAVLGQVIGNDTESTLLGAAIGGLAGGVAGHMYGDHVAKQKEKYAKAEDWLDACIASAEQMNVEMKAYNEKLAAEVTQLQQDAATLAGIYQQKKKGKKALVSKKAEIDATLARAEQQLQKAQQELDSQLYAMSEIKKGNKGGITNDQIAGLDKQIAQLEQAVGKLKEQTTSLASASNSLAV